MEWSCFKFQICLIEGRYILKYAVKTMREDLAWVVGRGRTESAARAGHMLYSALAVAGASALAPPSPIVVLGPGTLEMRLITSKLAARAGFKTSLISVEEAGPVWRRLMYGVDYSKAGVDQPSCAQLVHGSDAIGVAFNDAKAVCLICDSAPLPEQSLEQVLGSAPSLERVVLLSRMGVTRAGPGAFGLPSPAFELRRGEERLRAAASERGFGLSVIRVGALKGGGPGRVSESVVSGVDLGLSKALYDSLFELETALVTQAYDKFTLGLRLAAGDPIEPSNPVLRLAFKGSFDPREDETSRVVAGGALLAALRHDETVELSVSSDKGERAPTAGEWDELLRQRLAVSVLN